MKLPRLRWPLGGVGARSFIHLGREIPYTLARSARKSIGLKIDQRGLTVAAPRWASLGSIEGVLEAKAQWIERKLQEWHASRQHRDAGLSDWIREGYLPYLGRPHLLRLGDSGSSGLSRSQTHSARATIRLVDPQGAAPAIALHLDGAATDPVTVGGHLRRWLDRRARAHLGARIAHYAAQMQLVPARWQLSSAKTRWGSCNAKGVVRLSARLIHYPPEVIDYVVVHELAHLRELNHSARFWAVVESALPDYRERRALLRHHPIGQFTSSEDTDHADPAHHAQGRKS
jgi:predicted metal-dependent hydrolase